MNRNIFFGAIVCSLLLYAPNACMAWPEVLDSLADDVQQALIVVSDPDAIPTAEMRLWQRNQQTWMPVEPPIAAVVGRNGVALTGTKKEGDGRTPAGIFSLSRAFGYAENISTGLLYQQVTEQDFWIDDARSPLYNQWVRGPVPTVSHEQMRRTDSLYEYGIVVEYNTDPIVPGDGSAIFIHVWRGPGQATAGCIAVSKKDMIQLFGWLQPSAHPVIIVQINNHNE